jgi:hypothetical protein
MHILAKEPSGPESVKAADHFRPEVTVIILPCSFPGNTERLTGESSTEQVNGLNGCPIHSGNVSVSGDRGPVLGEDTPAILVDFHLPTDGESGSFKSKVKTLRYQRTVNPLSS